MDQKGCKSAQRKVAEFPRSPSTSPSPGDSYAKDSTLHGESAGDVDVHGERLARVVPLQENAAEDSGPTSGREKPLADMIAAMATANSTMVLGTGPPPYESHPWGSSEKLLISRSMSANHESFRTGAAGWRGAVNGTSGSERRTTEMCRLTSTLEFVSPVQASSRGLANI